MTNIETLCLNCMSDKGNKASCSYCENHTPNQRNAVALPPKTILNERFLIGRILGRPGGFGITYLAWDMLLDTTAAIKEFLPLSSVSRETDNISVRANSKQDQEMFNQGLHIFLKEAKVLAQFSHPNIVRIRDYFSANNTAYLVMEYHSGQPLDQIVAAANGRLNEEKAMEIMSPILDGLEAVHKKGFLHRDIKPQNIYLTDNGVPILLDFGASRFALADTTQTLTVILSAGYAPFEQYHEKGKQGPWSDIYSCGATLYYMVTGKMPINAIERQHNDQLLPAIKKNPQLSESFSFNIMKALAINPQARPQNINTLKNNLIDSSYTYNAAPHTKVISQPIKTALPIPITKPDRPTVVIRYDTSNKHSGTGRVFLYVGLAVALWFSWNSQQTQEKNALEKISTPLSEQDSTMQSEIDPVETLESFADEFDLESNDNYTENNRIDTPPVKTNTIQSPVQTQLYTGVTHPPRLLRYYNKVNSS